MGPGDLETILSRLPEEKAPQLLSSIHGWEDAGVFLLQDDLALVQTVDFFPPIVDDPYTFGEIAAANALSDVYAMGAKPLTALNIAAIPGDIDLAILEQILLGGYEKVRQAGAYVVGGHTIEDEELKYGLCITGVVDPKEMMTISSAKPGDCLILTKPIGTGILATALKGNFLEEDDISQAIDSMSTLNRGAAEACSQFEVSACTDVTGFGLTGHLYEMLRAGGVSAKIWADEVPLFEHTLRMASLGMIPGSCTNNRDYLKVSSELENTDPLRVQCLNDPQTSGGLLISIRPDDAEALLNDLQSGPAPDAALVGMITEGAENTITVNKKRDLP